MENITLNTEHQIKIGINKQKKTKKPGFSFFELLKQGEKLPETQPQGKNQESLSKVSAASRQETKKASEDTLDSQIPVNTSQTELVRNTHPDKHHNQKIPDTKLTKELSEPYSRDYHTVKERESGNLSTNPVNLQSKEKNTDEKPQADREIANNAVPKTQTMSGQETSNRLSTSDRGFKIIEKHESSSPEHNTTQTAQNHNRENPKKLTVKESQTEKNYSIKHQEIRNIKETANQQFNISRSIDEVFTGQETGEHTAPVLAEVARINQDTKQNSSNTQETARPDAGQELSVEAGMPAGEFLADGGSYSGENFSSQHQPGSSQQPAAERGIPQSRFNMSFSFMDTKISIQAGSNSMIMHINTSQVIDPSTVEKIRQILLENGFTNHNLIVRDRTKTAKIYTTNRAYTENRNSDGFKISA